MVRQAADVHAADLPRGVRLRAAVPLAPDGTKSPSTWMAVRLRRRCADEQIVAEVMQETYLTVCC
ncbi:hypothetical protein [Streptomyces shenzhenensis]|uniref:hypothetical protein n=1 Tax=Streptomyces shenzhenensis TaxID=943815 RepID=UPI0036AF8D7D